MVPISIDKFVNEKIHDEDLSKKDLKESILSAGERKKNGEVCIQCRQSIWAIGSGVTGMDMCFTCMTGDADHSEDYELDSVCYE